MKFLFSVTFIQPRPGFSAEQKIEMLCLSVHVLVGLTAAILHFFLYRFGIGKILTNCSIEEVISYIIVSLILLLTSSVYM